jgi:hypothetical protein
MYPEMKYANPVRVTPIEACPVLDTGAGVYMWSITKYERALPI